MVTGKDKVSGVPDSSDLTAQLREMQGKMREAQVELAEDTLTVKGNRGSFFLHQCFTYISTSSVAGLRSISEGTSYLQA